MRDSSEHGHQKGIEGAQKRGGEVRGEEKAQQGREGRRRGREEEREGRVRGEER